MPVLLSTGQYRQLLDRLHGFRSMFFSVRSSVLVDARTSWSDRFLFLRWPKINVASLNVLVVLDFSSNAQLVSIISLIGGFEGL